jgi:hypothetical protein
MSRGWRSGCVEALTKEVALSWLNYLREHGITHNGLSFQSSGQNFVVDAQGNDMVFSLPELTIKPEEVVMGYLKPPPWNTSAWSRVKAMRRSPHIIRYLS